MASSEHTQQLVENLDDDSPWRDVIKAFWACCKDEGPLWSVLAGAAVALSVVAALLTDVAERFENYVMARGNDAK